jgi:hypothetical protein
MPPTASAHGERTSHYVSSPHTPTPPRNQQELGRKATFVTIQTHHTNHMHTMTTIPLHHSTGVMTGIEEEKRTKKDEKKIK